MSFFRFTILRWDVLIPFTGGIFAYHPFFADRHGVIGFNEFPEFLVGGEFRRCIGLILFFLIFNV